MKFNGNRWAIACLSIAVIAAPVALAQQQQQDNSSQYTGVSHPPSDDTIVATPDEPSTPPPAAQTAKPSPQVYAPPPPSTETPAQQPAVAQNTNYAQSSNSKYDNTDYGIVTVPEPASQSTPQMSGNTAVLHTRANYNANADIVTSVPGSPNELPEGTEIRITLNNALSSNYTTAGAPFEGHVMMDVINNGSVIIPAGSTLRGHVTRVSQGHHFGPAATLRLRPETVILPDGTAYHLYAQVIDSWAKGTRTGSEGSIEPSAHVVKKTAEYGVGVGTGALVGAELAGPPGALAGSLIGAGLVTTHLLTQHPSAATVPAGSELIFSLTEPMDLTPTRN